MTKLFVREIVQLFGLSSYVVSDKDYVFLNVLWKTLVKAMGSTLCMSYDYHPETDKHIEVVNYGVEKYLRCFALEKP